MSTNPSPPIHYLLPLYPGFQLLDVAGPLDMLNILSASHDPSKSITLTFIASTLDPVPVKPISPLDPTTGKPKWSFPDWPRFDNEINTTFNQTIVPDVTYASYLSALHSNTISPTSAHKPIDVLLIPGGPGTRVSRTDLGTGQTTSNVADLVQFIPLIAPHVRHSIITVCTGSFILAQTGLLDGRRATTNMTRFDAVAASRPAVRWLRGSRWVRSLPSELPNNTNNDDDSKIHPRFHGEIWTSAGISAGIDVTLAFVATYYGGTEVARDAARKLEYDWKEIGEAVVDPMYGLPA